MIPAALWLLGGARKLFTGILALVTRYPWQCALVAALALSWWQMRRADEWQERAGVEASNHRKTKNNFRAAMAEWKRQAEAVKAERARLIKQGRIASRDAQATVERMAADNAGLRAYIAANRLRGKGAVPNNTTPGDRDAPVPAESASDPFVATRVSDLEICDDLYVYAFGAYEFTVDLRSRALAAPEFGK